MRCGGMGDYDVVALDGRAAGAITILVARKFLLPPIGRVMKVFRLGTGAADQCRPALVNRPSS